ncbi:hypothetical protein PGT21_027015 [Puccinia graminis f. sp. tritici]|uniref:Uncharacterized protein n=1 Tax=Puccinia graminis f. sp. tritici TaxID=56615 RepID=A0A5B0N1W6_PUCGR|nr:hypothetical protein PGT21_027015 [Puccinia graminis f. sp. tritici]
MSNPPAQDSSNSPELSLCRATNYSLANPTTHLPAQIWLHHLVVLILWPEEAQLGHHPLTLNKSTA